MDLVSIVLEVNTVIVLMLRRIPQGFITLISQYKALLKENDERNVTFLLLELETVAPLKTAPVCNTSTASSLLLSLCL